MNKKTIGRNLLVLNVVFTVSTAIYGIYNSLHLPLNDCNLGRPYSIHDAVAIGLISLPTIILASLMLRELPKGKWQLVFSIFGLVVLSLIAYAVTALFIFSHGFCPQF